jgi:hypothetical protein
MSPEVTGIVGLRSLLVSLLEVSRDDNFRFDIVIGNLSWKEETTENLHSYASCNRNRYPKKIFYSIPV